MCQRTESRKLVYIRLILAFNVSEYQSYERFRTAHCCSFYQMMKKLCNLARHLMMSMIDTFLTNEVNTILFKRHVSRTDVYIFIIPFVVVRLSEMTIISSL
jgi:hypothetical protein